MSRPPRIAAIAALSLAACAAGSARADDMPVIKVEMRDGVILPAVIEVPANTRFKLEISNTGKSPVEFESTELRREKALAAGSTSAIVFRTLDAGTYQVFDDFHPDAKATLVAK
ncbi:Cupredoxin-like domain-containing protein [Methylobacterium phyllostachyos]|uniref:Cupredoxin-like domain-containing protein n=1 Tax=Methylobacterium phyllostachyos TaxID=582672 RepID=A0A1H0J3S0_9HYPH|nr:cupredoxin domain-containing protein [Methylobacterium phyllostachyos]SDO38397.1 Cupredoxin-like domain-containing protein [Methylobacterium phyllostachyos]